MNTWQLYLLVWSTNFQEMIRKETIAQFEFILKYLPYNVFKNELWKFMTEFEKLFKIRESLLQLEKEIGIHELTNTQRSIMEFIGANKDMTLTDILDHELFKPVSISSVRRALNELIKSGKVVQKLSDKDRRQRILALG